MRPTSARSKILLLLCGLLVAVFVSSPAASATASRPATLSGRTTVTTAPGIATTLLKAGVLPLPSAGTRFGVGFQGGLTASYGFPITGGDPNLAAGSGDILHSGGITFVSLRHRLSVTDFDIDLTAGKVFATKVNNKPARVALLDLNLSALKVSTSPTTTVLSGITVALDPAGAGALNTTFGLKLPTDGSLAFGTATVSLHN